MNGTFKLEKLSDKNSNCYNLKILSRSWRFLQSWLANERLITAIFTHFCSFLKVNRTILSDEHTSPQTDKPTDRRVTRPKTLVNSSLSSSLSCYPSLFHCFTPGSKYTFATNPFHLRFLLPTALPS